MKKILLLIFILFCGLIFHQNILGKNGLIAGYQTRKEKEILLKYKSLLEKKRDELNWYIKYLKEDKNAYKDFAHDMGFFETEKKIIRFGSFNKGMLIDNEVELFFKNYLKENLEQEKIKNLQVWVSVLFYLIFGFFGVLIMLSGQKDE